MKNNYSNLSIPYYVARIEAMSNHIKKLEDDIEYLEIHHIKHLKDKIEFLEAELEIKEQQLKDNL
tara:strand:+ start:216 stop:410 length:195 start_codon:yes stop_codon:yes gene_type:complete